MIDSFQTLWRGGGESTFHGDVITKVQLVASDVFGW